MKENHVKTTEPDRSYFGEYPRSFRSQVHQLIAWGYQGAQKMIKSSYEEETAITGFIAEAIEDRFLINSPPWLEHYSVKDDPPVRKMGSSGRSRPRSDLIIQANFARRPEYVFEAKRLSKNGFGIDKYIGTEGIGRFVNGLYAQRFDEAAMLGYVQSDSLAHWRSKVKGAIDSNAVPLCLKSAQHDEMVLGDFPLEWVSEHERAKLGRSINVYHILLDCFIEG